VNSSLGPKILRPGNRVEEDPEGNPGQQQRRVACAVVLLALDSIRCLTQLVEGLPQSLLDLLVGGNACGDWNRSATADELVVDHSRRLVGVPHVLA